MPPVSRVIEKAPFLLHATHEITCSIRQHVGEAVTGWKSVTTGNNSGEIGVIAKAERLWGLGSPS